MSLLEIALESAKRGWYVFPCWPKTKKPMTPHGWKDATLDEDKIREWWTKTPDANIAIACNPSNLCVLDVDHGLDDETAFSEWYASVDTEETYAVRTGRRPEFGVQLYFRGAIQDVGLWKFNGCEGQIKSLGGYVMAAGSVHPDSGEKYEALSMTSFPDEYPVLETPQWVRKLQVEKPSGPKDDEPITANRNVELTRIAGKLRNAGLSHDAMELALLQVNTDRCAPPLDEDEVKTIARNAANWQLPETPVEVVIGKPAEAAEPVQPVDWRTHYHTLEEIENAPPASFLIEGFLQLDSITALAAPVGQRKSLVALNVAHALCTGEKLFGYFNVTKRPARVLYLCPEMGLQSFTVRLRKIGLLPFVGNTLFCRTMSAAGTLTLDELTPEELAGAVVVIDTAVRYLQGDENSSEHMRAFAEGVFRLMRDGASSVLLLHHSAKGTKETSELTLENAMRGSGELGAFVTSCWATRLQNPAEPYKSASYLVNVKQRDFESRAFEVTGSPDCRLLIVGAPGEAVLKGRNSADRDGKEEDAVQFIRDNPTMSVRNIAAQLKAIGVVRGRTWIAAKRTELFGTGVRATEA